MSASAVSGRWVIVLGDNYAPVFWSEERESLERVCGHIRRTCPGARVVWQNMAGAGPAERAVMQGQRALDAQTPST